MESYVGAEAVLSQIAAASDEFYVYMLRWPDGRPCWGGRGTPFYVGRGSRDRLFEHVKNAHVESSDTNGLPRNLMRRAVILGIHQLGQAVVHTVDSFWADVGDADQREVHLINEIGLIRDGTGILTNRQRYEFAESDWTASFRAANAVLPTRKTPPQ